MLKGLGHFVWAGLLLLQWAVLARPARGCTSYLVARGATKDGCTMVSYAADSHIRYGELYFRPRADWPAGSMVTLYDRGTARPLGQIPQVAHTYQVVGFMNEHQVAIGESTFDGRAELRDTTGLVDYGSLMFLALQRARTAREAIAVIADLVERYGYASTGESFSIGDPTEVWIMELIGKGTELVYDKRAKRYVNRRRGAVWVARRVPDGHICAHANQARIRQFPLADGVSSVDSRSLARLSDTSVRTVYAHDAIAFARERGYFDGADADFSFADAYAPLTFDAMRFCEMRVWTMFNELADGMELYWDYAKGLDRGLRLPLWVRPNRQVEPRDLFSCKRNWLQGTELDMTQDVGAGPFGCPYRWRPLTWQHGEATYFNERATATQQTGFSFVAQMRGWLPRAIGGLLWFGVDDVSTTLYMPIYSSVSRVPGPLAEGNGDMLRYAGSSAFWVFNRVAHFAYLFYNRTIGDIRSVQADMEDRFADYVQAADAGARALWGVDSVRAVEFLTDFTAMQVESAVAQWERLGEYLLVKYLDGNVKRERDGAFERNAWGYPVGPAFPGYGPEWKESVVRETGDKLLRRR